MSQQTRAELILALEAIGRRFPSWRFGQLVENVAGWADVSAWDVDDEQLLAAARGYLDQLSLTPDDEPAEGQAAREAY